MSDDRQAKTPPTTDQIIETYLLRREEALERASGDKLEGARAARALLSDFMRRFPHASRALEDCAAVESLIESSPDVESGTAGSRRAEEAFVQRGMETVARLLAARRVAQAAGEATTPLVGLKKEAEARGLTIQNLAAATRMTVSLLVKLDRRLIRFASIPRQAIERIAAELGRSVETVAAYLQGDPQFASQASFRADTAPQLTNQQDFFEAVETDLQMSEDHKDEWRKIKSAD
jgi:transcriptional regulator with XRE-family HTH domain